MWAAQYRATNGSYDPGVAEPWEWREQDLLDLITNGVQENLNLDYKHRASLDNNDVRKNEIGKDVSAFANSDGGTLVYGMEENGHLPVRLEGVDPSVTTREWLEQVINSKIRPKVDAIRINPIPLTAPRTGTVFVVYVPASRAQRTWRPTTNTTSATTFSQYRWSTTNSRMYGADTPGRCSHSE